MGPETGLNLPAQRAIQRPNGNFKQTVILRLILRLFLRSFLVFSAQVAPRRDGLYGLPCSFLHHREVGVSRITHRSTGEKLPVKKWEKRTVNNAEVVAINRRPRKRFANPPFPPPLSILYIMLCHHRASCPNPGALFLPPRALSIRVPASACPSLSEIPLQGQRSCTIHLSRARAAANF